MISTQSIRLIDVFIIAPFLIYAGTRKGVVIWLSLALIIIGFATLMYNGINYLKNKE